MKAVLKILEERKVNADVLLHPSSGRQLPRGFSFAVIRLCVNHVHCEDLSSLMLGKVQCSGLVYPTRQENYGFCQFPTLSTEASLSFLSFGILVSPMIYQFNESSEQSFS